MRLLLLSLLAVSLFGQAGLTPGRRTVLDSHNCYPYEGRFADRIEPRVKTGAGVFDGKDANILWQPHIQRPADGVHREIRIQIDAGDLPGGMHTGIGSTRTRHGRRHPTHQRRTRLQR